MKTFIAWLMTITVLISGCTFNYEVLTPAPQATWTPVATQPTAYSTQPVVNPSATFTPTAVPVAPTLLPSNSEPIFFNGRSSATQDDHLTRQSSFPGGTKIVYVIWDYGNMRDGMQIRREWYLDGQPWLTREEAWDFAKYGSTGTMRDVSIHDEVNGLDSGVYHMRVYIDNVLQPIGGVFYEPIEEWVSFEIGTGEEESFMGYGSWDGQWGVEVYGEKRIFLKNALTGETRLLHTAQEVPYVAWFRDSKHFLFVDRDRSEQKPGTEIGIRDHLWIVDVPSGVLRRVHKGDKAFAGSGPDPSPDGKFIASLEGSGYGDGCFKDFGLIFFEVASDFNSVRAINQQDFSGVPAFNEGWVFPVRAGFWQSDTAYHVTLDGTCNADKSQLGPFIFNVSNRTAAKNSAQPIPGDLGIGLIHGRVTDVATGAPISNAAVTCDQHSYTSSPVCSGTVLTNSDGEYAFNNVFFHDTDTIEITVAAAGYETVKVGWHAFTTNDMSADVQLHKTP